MKKKVYALLTVAIFALSGVSAQVGNSVYIKHAAVFPSLQFNQMPELVIPGQNSFGSAGGAMTGAAVGIKYSRENLSFDWGGVGLFVSGECMWNMLKKDLRTQYDLVDCHKPMYFNIPILAGLNYFTPGSVVRGWAEVGLGADILLKTDEGWPVNMIDYKASGAFCMEVGVGMLLTEFLSIGAHYYWLGVHNIKVESGVALNDASKMNAGAWTVNLDFRLPFYFY